MIWFALASLHVDGAEELGQQCACICNDGRCQQIARWLVPWPGREAIAQCDRHYLRALEVAAVFTMAELIRAVTRQLDVWRREVDQDPSAARFAAMELA